MSNWENYVHDKGDKVDSLRPSQKAIAKSKEQSQVIDLGPSDMERIAVTEIICHMVPIRGKEVNLFRSALGLSTEKLARGFKISAVTVLHWEKGLPKTHLLKEVLELHRKKPDLNRETIQEVIWNLENGTLYENYPNNLKEIVRQAMVSTK